MCIRPIWNINKYIRVSYPLLTYYWRTIVWIALSWSRWHHRSIVITRACSTNNADSQHHMIIIQAWRWSSRHRQQLNCDVEETLGKLWCWTFRRRKQQDVTTVTTQVCMGLDVWGLVTRRLRSHVRFSWHVTHDRRGIKGRTSWYSQPSVRLRVKSLTLSDTNTNRYVQTGELSVRFRPKRLISLYVWVYHCNVTMPRPYTVSVREVSWETPSP